MKTNSPETGFGKKTEQIPAQTTLVPIGLVKDLYPVLSTQANSLPRLRKLYFHLSDGSFAYAQTLESDPKDAGYIENIRLLLENDTARLRSHYSQFNRNHLPTSSDRARQRKLADESQKHARALLRASGIDPFSIKRFELDEIPEGHRKHIQAQLGLEDKTFEQSIDTSYARVRRSVASGAFGYKRLVPLQAAATGIITGGLLLGSLARPTPSYAAESGRETRTAVSSEGVTQGKVDTIVLPEAESSTEPADTSGENEVIHEKQDAQNLSLLTGSQLEAEILKYAEGDILPLVSEGAPKDIWKDVIEIDDNGRVTLKADTTRPVVVPEVGLTVEERVRYNSEAHTVEIGTVRSYSDKVYQIFVSDTQGVVSRFYLPKLSYQSESLAPVVNEKGLLVYRNSVGSEIVTYGDAVSFVNGDANPLITSVISDSVSFAQEEPSGVGGGSGSLVYAKNESEPVYAISTSDSAGSKRINYVLTTEGKSFPISFSRALLPKGAVVIFDPDGRKFELQVEGKRYAIFDPEIGQFSYLATTDKDSINIRPDPSTVNTPVGQYAASEDILIQYKYKPEGDEYEWMKTDRGWVRADLIKGRTDFLISAIPLKDSVTSEVAPIVNESLEDFKPQYTFPEPPSSLLEQVGLDLQTATFKSELLAGSGETYKIRIYDSNGNFVLIGETNEQTAGWEWKESVLEGVPYPDSKMVTYSLKTYTRDLGFSESEVMSRLRYEPRTDFRGESYPLLVDTQTGYPVLVWIQDSSGESKWAVPNINTLSPKKGLEFGLALSKADKDWNSYEYETTVKNNARVVVPVGHSQLTIDQWGETVDDSFVEDAFNNGQAVRFTLFWHHADIGKELQGIYDQYKDTPELQGKVSEFMDKRIDQVLAIAERAAVLSGKEINEVDLEMVIGNEAFWESGGQLGWEKSPYLDAFQSEDANYPVWLVEAYVKTFSKLKDKGFSMDRVKLIYNDYGIESGGNKSKLVLPQLKLVKAEIAKRLGITVEEVMLYVGMQSHFNLPGMEEGDKINSSIIELPIFTQNMRDFAQAIGPVMHTEIYQTVGTIAQKAANIVALTEACEQVGPQVCEGVTFYGMMRVENQDWQILFDQEFKNTTAYWELLKTLSSDSVVQN